MLCLEFCRILSKSLVHLNCFSISNQLAFSFCSPLCVFSFALFYFKQQFYCTDRTWIVGDSIVKGAGFHHCQLKGSGTSYWLGEGGAKLVRIPNLVKSSLSLYPFPTTLIVHAGTCDLFSVPLFDVRQRILDTLTTLRNMLPNTRIIWSDVLQRRYYHREDEPGCGKSCLITINKFAFKVCKSIGNACVARHYKVIFPADRSLYHRDGLHLSDKGSAVFRNSLQRALLYFNEFPEEVSFLSL